MDSRVERGKVNVEIDGVPLSLGYEISNFREHEFDLVVWYRGAALKDRVRWEILDPHEQIEVFAQMLVEQHLKANASSS
ncbi:MAG TPA: hypothetical protein VHP37_15170 [Burkholderiales bacterium]|nr:hypothetical protein [Burkholderiales bacterium]